MKKTHEMWGVFMTLLHERNVRFSAEISVKSYSNGDREVFVGMEEREGVSAPEVAAHADVSDKTGRRFLKGLEEKGVIEKINENKTHEYDIVDPTSVPRFYDVVDGL